MKKIMLLEDDVMIASGLVYALDNEGYEVVHLSTVKDAITTVKNTKFDLGILDMQLPDGTGFDVCACLKEKNTPVIFLTIVDDESKIVRAFDEGVDDYVVKPFRIRELLARVKRTINKQNGVNQEIIELGNVNINITSGKVFIGEKLLELTALEYRLLLIFAKNKSKLLTRSQILEHIWDIDGNFVEDNTLTVYIKRLREKLGDAVNIETVRGIGYRVD
ncbi:response regulator transcription factor [Roseburia sp. 499]|uniref:response regulator transcription factor n=1 Tax=Roseburia sp. 499 TaxID=1261634 RepID=UPI000AB4831A|nr:response regulator transcription factor [Roseburia sp. 499]WVK69190.1 response regulator transcription factor [Roseburia sp. 499]